MPAAGLADSRPDANVRCPRNGRGEYKIIVVRGIWYAWRCDGTRTTAIQASSDEGLQAAIAVDRAHWVRPRIPLT
jgi:hypothetical protein